MKARIMIIFGWTKTPCFSIIEFDMCRGNCKTRFGCQL